jgi:hypothetical protein
MARVHAQHANAGRYHLETWYDEYAKKWGWRAKAIKQSDTRLHEYADMADTLDGAKRSAEASIGLTNATEWIDIGPAIIVPD